MKILVLGASGIIGQHLMLSVPAGVTPVFARRTADRLHIGVDLNDRNDWRKLLNDSMPDAIINLAGESRPDVVERDAESYTYINAQLARELAGWCKDNGRHYVHVSTQAVFSGNQSPYHSASIRSPINSYGIQKFAAEVGLEWDCRNWTIARPTFVLGIRPIPSMGRQNPAEQMLTLTEQRQVCDRWFSISFARDVAAELWQIALAGPQLRAINIGVPIRTNRHILAMQLTQRKAHITPVSHDEFPGLAPRPFDTTYAAMPELEAIKPCELYGKFDQLRSDMEAVTKMDVRLRAKEISLYTGQPETVCLERLNKGFGVLHNEVAADFNRACPSGRCSCATGICVDPARADYQSLMATSGHHPSCLWHTRRPPSSDDELLEWYRVTSSYIYELSVYHCDQGFNYFGMCDGIADRLRSDKATPILCLGDGIGDLTLSLYRAGFDAVYHDLAGSKTAEFARHRYWMYTGKEMPTAMTSGWAPDFGGSYGAVVSLDFMEHLTPGQVNPWMRAVFSALKPGGVACFQNAFAIGSGSGGSIPMHLSENDRYERDWDPEMAAIGFIPISSNWYQRPYGE